MDNWQENGDLSLIGLRHGPSSLGDRNYLLHLSSHFLCPMCGIFLGRRKEMKRIVMIVGSLRKESFNRKIAQYIESLI